MSKEVRPSNEEKISVRDSVRKQMREALSNVGDLASFEAYKEPGYRYYIGNNKPGRVDYIKSQGYEIVLDKNQKMVSKQGGHGIEMIFFRIPMETYKIRQELKEEKNAEWDAALGKSTKGRDFENVVVKSD